MDEFVKPETWKFLFEVLREMSGFRDKKYEVFANFMVRSCDTTPFSRFLLLWQFPVILRFFFVQKIQKFGRFWISEAGKFWTSWSYTEFLFFIWSTAVQDVQQDASLSHVLYPYREKFYLEYYKKYLDWKTKTLNFLHTFTIRSYDMTQSSRFLAIMQFYK